MSAERMSAEEVLAVLTVNADEWGKRLAKFREKADRTAARKGERDIHADRLCEWAEWQRAKALSAHTAVAAMIEREAALLAEREAMEKRVAEQEAENKALREMNKVMRDALEWYASDPSVWVSFAPHEYQKQFDAANASPHLTRIADDSRGHPQFAPNERRAEEAIAAVDAIDAARAEAGHG